MPNVDGSFDGIVGRTVEESTEAWPRPTRPPAGAPNVVVVVLDDVGFSQLGCYGSEIETPNMDRLAAGGLRYNNFHTTALCSPTRACLLTGRNHHSVGVGAIMEIAVGFPGQDSMMPRSAATVAEMLRQQGYNTWCVGKWHLTPEWERSSVGPFDRWPLGQGFERYYGFMGGETDQYAPTLVADNHRIEPPATAAEGYHLSEDLVDQASRLVREQKSVDPDRPFLLYLALGACHAPHQVPRPFIDKYRGRFDSGWDEYRERVLARQKQMGIVPEETQLAPRNIGVKAWDDLEPDAQRLFCRMQEVFAGFLDHADAQVGRLLDALEEVGQLDDTLFVLFSDNGASQEGGPDGAFNEMSYFNAVLENADDILPHIDELGSPTANNHYPWGWAQAGNTPLKRYKQDTHGGGIRDPLIVHWPRRITDAGAVRTQYHHAVDITPTILEAIGVDAPQTVDGVTQMPLHGTSLAYTFDDGAAPGRKRHQYFEMLGHRAIYQDGWKAVSHHEMGISVDDDRWELYHVDEDFSEANDLAAAHPEKLRQLVDLWWAEAGRYGVLPVLPLEQRIVLLFQGAAERPRATPLRGEYVYYPGISTIPENATHDVRNASHHVTAEVVVPDEGADGVLWSQGGRFGGFTFFAKGGKLVYDHNFVGAHYRVEAETVLAPGPHTVEFDFAKGGAGGAGDVTITVDGTEVGSGRVARTVQTRFAADEGFDIGCDRGTPVAPQDYDSPFPFTGEVRRVVVSVADVPGVDHAAEHRAALGTQ